MVAPIPNPSGWPIVRPGLLMAYVGRICFVYMNERLGEEGERVHSRELASAIDARPLDVRVGVLYEVPHSLGISALARSSLAKLLNERREILRRTTAAYALATPAAFVRGMLQAVFWIAPPPYPYAMVPDRRRALEAIARHLPDMDVAATDRECTRLVDAAGSARADAARRL